MNRKTLPWFYSIINNERPITIVVMMLTITVPFPATTVAAVLPVVPSVSLTQVAPLREHSVPTPCEAKTHETKLIKRSPHPDPKVKNDEEDTRPQLVPQLSMPSQAAVCNASHELADVVVEFPPSPDPEAIVSEKSAIKRLTHAVQDVKSVEVSMHGVKRAIWVGQSFVRSWRVEEPPSPEEVPLSSARIKSGANQERAKTTL